MITGAANWMCGQFPVRFTRRFSVAQDIDGAVIAKDFEVAVVWFEPLTHNLHHLDRSAA